jgi:Na+-transporting methylmalonyl-CoA/oxaloacetate decarboxylase gamma subunit
MEKFNVQNIIDGQAIGISITGMSIVFSGLLLISIYIWLLPNILKWSSRKQATGKAVKAKPKTVKEKAAAPVVKAKTTTQDEFNDIASVIGLVLQLEHERLTKVDNEQITISRNIDRPSMWGTAGKMRKIPQRRTHA